MCLGSAHRSWGRVSRARSGPCVLERAERDSESHKTAPEEGRCCAVRVDGGRGRKRSTVHRCSEEDKMNQ
eukprot:899598-Rhodomonas_salina.1